MICSKSGSTWTTKSSGADKTAPFIGNEADGCAKMYAAFNPSVDVVTQHYWFAPKTGATAVSILCQIRGGSMKAVDDGKTEGKALASCDAAYKLLPKMVESDLEIDNEFYLKIGGKTLLYVENPMDNYNGPSLHHA